MKEAELESREDRLRLQYGLDLLAKAPTIATIATGTKDCLLKLANRLPPHEMRLIHALADDVSPNPDKLPGHFRFEVRWRLDIESVLNGLGIQARIESPTRS